MHQYRDEYAAKYHLELAWLMHTSMPRRAAYELARYMEIKQRKGQHVASSAVKLQIRLAQVSPVTSDEEQVLYERSAAAVEKILR